MIILTITRSDGSLYWVEHFNSIEAGQAWLSEEKTRPYWNKKSDGDDDNFSWDFQEIAATSLDIAGS